MRYLLTFACEFVHSWKSRNEIHCKGKHGIMGLISWSHTVAKYTSRWRHPYYYCCNRAAWELWMIED